MRPDDPAGRGPDLPADDLPSAEVLDELLRAFSAEDADAQVLEQIDLSSPEVAELLAPSSPTPAPDQPPDEPEPELQVEVTDKPELAVEGSTSAPTVDEPATAQETEQPVDEDEAPSSATTRTIVIDASDDPPDAVYLAAGDPLLAASAGARGLVIEPPAEHDARSADAPVFIDDAAVEAGETISLADASSATRIEPRLRERRIAVKRAVGRKRLRWALVVVAVLVVAIAALAVLGSSLFAIEEVRVDGAVNTDPTRLQAVIDDLQGTPVLRADTDRAERELETIPWVADARVSAEFPHDATIEIRERSPVATYQGVDQRFRLIDIDGRVLDVLDGQPIDFLVITSPDVADLDAGQFAAQGFIAAANLVRALTPELRALAAGVTVTGNGSDLRMALPDGREVRFGAGRDLVVKLVRLQTKLDELAGGGFRYLDVSTDEVTTG